MKQENRESYMVALRNAMLWQYGNREIRTTLEDVGSLYEEGTGRGRTEREMSEELGAPRELVHTIAQEGQIAPRGSAMLRRIGEILLLCALTVYLVVAENNGLSVNDSGRTALVYCLSTLCFPALVCDLLGGSSLYHMKKRPSALGRSYLLCAVIAVLLAGFAQFTILRLCRGAGAGVLGSYYAIRVLTAAGFLLLLVLAVRLYRGDGWCLGVFAMVLGTIGSLAVCADFLRTFDAPPQSPLRCVCVFPCVLGLLSATAVWFFGRMGGKKP